MFTEGKFNEYCFELFLKWFEHFKEGEYEQCDEIADTHISFCKEGIIQEKWPSEEQNNVAYVAGVLFKGLKEYIELAVKTRDSAWQKNQGATSIWNLMWNCFDRLKFCNKYIISDELNELVRVLNLLHQNFEDGFGKGIYFSPEIIYESALCSICKQDSRSCMHINGRIYNGKRCVSIPKNPEARGVPIVPNPKDPRCRVWHWNTNKEESTMTAPILIPFQIDDWLNDEISDCQTHPIKNHVLTD